MSGCTWRAPNEITGLRRRGVDALAGRRRPARRLGEHPEHRRLVQRERPVARLDPEDDLLGRDRVAVGQRLDDRARLVDEHVAEQVGRLAHAAQHGVAPAEDLHRHDGVEALALEDAGGAREVHVGRGAGQDLVRRADPLRRPSPGPVGRGDGEAVTVGALLRHRATARPGARPGCRRAGV